MIEAREIRIGNWISAMPNGELPIQVGFIPGSLPDENSYPLPLTEEWLEKFGFEKDCWKRRRNGKQYYWSGEYITKAPKFVLSSDMYFTNPPGREFGWPITKLPSKLIFRSYSNKTEVNYVHQLQNLFFAICGEELTITE